MVPVARRALACGGLLAVLGLSLALRLSGLADKPLHYDEGVNGWFTLRLYWWNLYHFQPDNYHGPFLYYANLVFFWLLGPSEVALRLATALAGGLLCVALLPARRFTGDAALLVAGVLLALGPGLVYFSRTCIHEIHLVLFTALWAVSLARFAETPRVAWALASALAAAGCFIAKETAIITGACLACGAGLAWLLGRPGGADAAGGERDLFGGRGRREALVAWAVGARGGGWIAAMAFAAVIVVFYSSFFSFAAGVSGFFEAYGPWFEYGTTGRNQGKPFGYIWRVMADTERAYRLVAVPALLLALARRDRVGLALAGWAGSAFLVYSLIPYKTPWCVLEIDLPVFLLVAWGAGRAWRALRDPRLSRPLRAGALIAAVACLAPAPDLLQRSLADNRERYDDFRRRYVYYQTFEEFYDMLRDMLGAGDAAPGADGRGPRVVNVALEFPVSWYTLTRGWAMDRSVYLEEAPSAEEVGQAQLILSDDVHVEEVERRIAEAGGDWHRERYFPRPGLVGYVFYRRAVWDAYQAAGGREGSPWPRPPARPLPAPARPSGDAP